MNDWINRRNLPSRASIVAVILVGVGIFLWMFVDKSLLFVAGLGAFGPGILREIGVLGDHDEFQREAARRAGHHAYLLGGMAVVIIASLLEWDAVPIRVDGEWPLVVLLVLWLTWLFSAVTDFWGARRTTSTVLIAFGSFLALFVLADFVGESNPDISTWETVLGFLVGILLVGSFFVPAWTAHRWPRATGAALLALTLVLFVVFRWAPGSGVRWSMMGPIDVIIFGPLLACGIALLRDRTEPNHDDADARSSYTPLSIEDPDGADE